MKTLLFVLFPIFLHGQVISDSQVEIACPQCTQNMGLVFKSSGQINLILCVGGGKIYVLHENKLKSAAFRLMPEGIEVYFDGRKIYFTQNIAYEDDKRYICSAYGLSKFRL